MWLNAQLNVLKIANVNERNKENQLTANFFDNQLIVWSHYSGKNPLLTVVRDKRRHVGISLCALGNSDFTFL